MAQKQFKIGLSNTDKQNMAQDVYERLLALTFNEYDTTTEYEVGDFVVYNDQLYKCIGATSGAWDSTKWQLATLNDLVDDIENAVAFVNDKANVDGNYPTMTVGVADQLSPYDENSGDDQDEPFSFQATGTGNGTQPDFATGSIALMKEKQGNTVVVNQLSRMRASITVNGLTITKNADGTLDISGTYDGTASYDQITLDNNFWSMKANHKYLIFKNKEISCNWGILGFGAKAGNVNYFIISNVNDFTTGVMIKPSANEEIDISKLIGYSVDLTQWFNGDIPQDLLDNPDNFFRYYQGSLAYNTGTLVNANGRYIKCIGRQQWDEVAKLGYYINPTTGEAEQASGFYCTENFIPVTPSVIYHIHKGTASTHRVLFYDTQKNFIGSAGAYAGAEQDLTMPSNCCYVKFWVNQESYGNDVTFSRYYSGESGYDQYYPYEVLTNNDTGTEVLRSAGSVKDYKTPDGTITRKVGRVKLKDLTFTKHGTQNYFYFTTYSAGINIKFRSSSYGTYIYPLSCSKYISAGRNDLTTKPFVMCADGSSSAVVQVQFNGGNFADATEFKNQFTDDDYLYYELAEPTTEQGTPFSENLVIDDFGSMDFGGTNGVPQGNLIFYPVDYKAFVDTLYDYTDGTPSDIALKSDLNAEQSARESVDTQLLNAVGGTLRHCLATQESGLNFEDTDFVDLGELTWTYVGNNAFSAINVGVKSVANDAVLKALSTKYQVVSYNTLNGDATKVCMCGYVGSDSRIYVRDTAYTDATAFKNAMKGVLLAYEKASE